MKSSRYIPLFLTLLLLAACSGHRHDDKQIFRYNESAGIATLDPAFAKDQSIIWGCRQLYNGLIQLDTNLQVQPCIAKRWDISNDGLRYTFTLRNDVRFHNGRTVTAHDFAYSFHRIVDPSVASPGAWIFGDVEDFLAIDDTTFAIRLKEPFAPFLSMLGMVYCSVVPREVVEQYGKDGKVESFLEAENCIVDRKTKTGWVEGDAIMTYGKSTVKGRGVHFSVDREFIKIFSKSEIRTTGLKIDPAKTLDMGRKK
jgi:ABC-type transport system substrate-binding protein